MNRLKIALISATLAFLIIISIFGISLLLPDGSGYDNARAENYEQKIIEKINLEIDGVTLEEIFDFDFNRAYVFKDSYISGIGFAKRYNLDISIDQVPTTDYENIRRIIFVDIDGKFIYEFRYSIEKMSPKVEGMIVYPTTKIRKCPSTVEGSTGFEFMGVNESDYY